MTPATLSRALLPLLLAITATADSAALRERLRERLGERAAAAAGPAVPATALPPGAAILAPGRYQVALQHQGLSRRFLVHVPASYRRETPAPLVLALHGGGGGMIYQANDALYGLISKSEAAGFIAVFPNGVSPVSSGMLATWNAGRCCGRARDDQVDDVGFLRQVIADVATRTTVDRRRVYVIGMSNGAMMAYRMACEAADVVRGIMAVAGTDNTTQCRPSQPVAVLHVHARNDDRVLFSGGAGRKFRREDLVTDFTSVPDTIAAWVQRNRAAPAAREVLRVPGAACERHDARSDGAPVQLCVTEDGGHSWPGGSKPRGAERPSEALRANDVMWEFFTGL